MNKSNQLPFTQIFEIAERMFEEGETQDRIILEDLVQELKSDKHQFYAEYSILEWGAILNIDASRVNDKALSIHVTSKFEETTPDYSDCRKAIIGLMVKAIRMIKAIDNKS